MKVIKEHGGEVNKKTLINEMIRISQSAGKMLARYQKQTLELRVENKQAQGVVSEADIASEKYVEKELKKLLPEANFIGEEGHFLSGKDVHEKIPSGYNWIVDPLDGTNNFLAGMDYFSVCLSLCEGDHPLLGVVHRPILNETYYATRGGGAFLKRGETRAKRLEIAPLKRPLKECIVSTGFSTEKGIKRDWEFDSFKKILKSTRAVRRMGSASLDMCLVAQGIFDGFWEIGLAPWDVAASGVICEEAGLQISDFKGRPCRITDGEILVGTSHVNYQIQKLIGSINKSR